MQFGPSNLYALIKFAKDSAGRPPFPPASAWEDLSWHPVLYLYLSRSLTRFLCCFLVSARAGSAHRRLQGLDIACEICPATWQRHLRMPSEYGAKDFDGIPPECHRWVGIPPTHSHTHTHTSTTYLDPFPRYHPLVIRIVSVLLLAFARTAMVTFHTPLSVLGTGWGGDGEEEGFVNWP